MLTRGIGSPRFGMRGDEGDPPLPDRPPLTVPPLPDPTLADPPPLATPSARDVAASPLSPWGGRPSRAAPTLPVGWSSRCGWGAEGWEGNSSPKDRDSRGVSFVEAVVDDSA